MYTEYGKCHVCGTELEPVWFIEQEFKQGLPTGRRRRACSHLVCNCCGHAETVDDTFDGPWQSSIRALV